ncbi:MAG: hypothetical protein ACI81Y_002709, partial [Glaciecola sp.]
KSWNRRGKLMLHSVDLRGFFSIITLTLQIKRLTTYNITIC